MTGIVTLSHLMDQAQNLISSNVKALIERKHLYQAVDLELDLGKLFRRLVPNPEDIFVRTAAAQYQVLIQSPWCFSASAMAGFRVPGPPRDEEKRITLVVARAMLFCSGCDGVQAHLWARSYDQPERLVLVGQPAKPVVRQHFLAELECQACAQSSIVLTIARTGYRLTMVGRSPIEVVQVPPELPRKWVRYYSDSQLALQSGQILPALFMLRVFIEQVVRDGDVEGREMDVIFGRYSAGLAPAVRDTAPSLRLVYDALSEALHSANADEALYRDSAEKVCAHFDLKRSVARLGTGRTA